MRRRPCRAAALVLLAALVAGCGAGDDASTQAAGPSAPSGNRYTGRVWYDAELGGDTRHVTVTFDAPDGDGCDEIREPRINASSAEVTLIIAALEPWAPTTCAMRPTTLDVDLGEPLGSRPLVVTTTRWAFRVVDGALRLDPASTPCGRQDCSSPSDTPADCAEVGAAAFAQVDGADPAMDPIGCDGSFAVVAITVGAGGCPPDDRSKCARAKRVFLVARNGSWNLVTYGSLSCDDVWTATRIQFPAGVCPR